MSPGVGMTQSDIGVRVGSPAWRWEPLGWQMVPIEIGHIIKMTNVGHTNTPEHLPAASITTKRLLKAV